jgi:8-oxo-dGTP pyrophosphatase MutT (NUDIX family)
VTSLPAQAASIILIRDGRHGPEVLLTKRRGTMSVLAGVWVFPGGKVESVDALLVDCGLATPWTLTRPADLAVTGGTMPPSEVVTGMSAVAACRELFEETGLLLASRADGSQLDATQHRSAQQWRREVASGADRFVDLLRRENLQIDAGALRYWAHWITPSDVPRRFDTRFFLARAPGQQDPSADMTESVEVRWIAPSAATAEPLLLAAPTALILRDLAESIDRHGSIGALLAAARIRAVVTMLPKLLVSQGMQICVLPWDREYDALPGDRLPAGVDPLPHGSNWPSRLPAVGRGNGTDSTER